MSKIKALIFGLVTKGEKISLVNDGSIKTSNTCQPQNQLSFNDWAQKLEVSSNHIQNR